MDFINTHCFTGENIDVCVVYIFYVFSALIRERIKESISQLLLSKSFLQMTIRRTLAVIKFKIYCKTILRNLIHVSISICQRLRALSRVSTYLELHQRKLVMKAFTFLLMRVFYSRKVNETKYSRMAQVKYMEDCL